LQRESKDPYAGYTGRFKIDPASISLYTNYDEANEQGTDIATARVELVHKNDFLPE